MSIPLQELIEKHCGGIRGGWDNLKGSVDGFSHAHHLCPRPITDAHIDAQYYPRRLLGPDPAQG